MSIQKAIPHLYYRWHALETRLSNGFEVIDFDLGPREYRENIGKPFEDREAVLKEIDKLCSEIERTSDTEFKNKEFIAWKLRGSHAAIRTLLGEKISFADLLHDTMGIYPTNYGDREWGFLQRQLAMTLKELGFDLEKESREEIQSKLYDQSVTEFIETLRHAAKFWVSLVREELGLEYDPEYQIETTEVDSYWLNWISKRSNEPILLRINTHPRNPVRRGDDHYFASHEIGAHAVQAACLESFGQANMLDPGALLTTVHTVEQFQFEGLAMSVLLLLQRDKEPSKWATARALASALTSGLENEAHFRLHEGENMDAAVKYVMDRHPICYESSIRADLKERIEKPLLGVYQYIYYPGFSAFMQLEQIERNKRKILLKEMFSGFFTPEQIRIKFDEA